MNVGGGVREGKRRFGFAILECLCDQESIQRGRGRGYMEL